MLDILTDPKNVLAVFLSLAVFATMVTVMLPLIERNGLKSRMKSVTAERETIRARERARLKAEANERTSLRKGSNTSLRQMVEKLNLRRALVDKNTEKKLRMAGYRSQNALNAFLFARFMLPFVFFLIAVVCIFWFEALLVDYSSSTRLLACVFFTFLGFYAPNIFVNNAATKRQTSIHLAWPDALDLTLICIEAGTSIEASFRRVADEIAGQSPELAEELVLTTAELSYLSERRMGFQNFGERTGVDAVKSVCQALIQAERYGTPISNALRVLAQESRDKRMTDAEKKAAALPPKLTVPMILFFLPVIFVVILGPAIMEVMDIQ